MKDKKEAGTKVLASFLSFGLSSKTQWLSGLNYADFISFYSPTQLCGGGTTKSNSNELPISVPLSFLFVHSRRDYIIPKKRAAIPTAKRARMIVIGDTFFLSNHMQRKVRRSPINPGINEFN